MPAISGWSSGMQPQPIRVGIDRHAGELGELDQQVGGVGVDDAAARDDQRPLGRVQHRRAPSRSGAGVAAGL